MKCGFLAAWITDMPDVSLRCTICGALLDEEDLFCHNCGTEAPLIEPREKPGRQTSTHNFECSGCGASMSYDASAQTLRCPFCGSGEMEQRPDAEVLAPTRVVPFELDRERALGIMRTWLGNSFWRPGDLAATAVVTKMTQVYVPYWIFQAVTSTYWTADTSQTPPGARGNWAPVTGEHQGRYSGVVIGASSALTPNETSAICPFDLSRGVPPAQVDLDNVIFEQFRVQRKYARPLAHQGLEDLEREACTQYVPGRCRNLKVNVRLENLASEPVLLPVWIMAYSYRDQVFRFVINGQSGRATGQAPTSWTKIILVIAAVLLCILAMLACAGFFGAFGNRPRHRGPRTPERPLPEQRLPERPLPERPPERPLPERPLPQEPRRGRPAENDNSLRRTPSGRARDGGRTLDSRSAGRPFGVVDARQSIC